jgi:Kef-type K+ transport system membrane component KefB
MELFKNIILSPLFFIYIFIALPAFAYGGPGSIVSGVGALLAVGGVIILAILGFIWYPVKRVLQTFKSDEKEGQEEGPK